MKLTTSLKWSRSAGVSIATCFISLSISTVRAADIEWDAGGGMDTDFNTPANWNTNTVPVAGDNAFINGTATITGDTANALNVLEVGRWWGTGTVTQTAGTVYTAGFNVGFVGTGTYNLNGSGSINMTNDFLLGHSGGGTDAGAGTLNMNTTGSFTTTYVKIADSSWGANMTSGTFNHSAGTTTSTYGFNVGGNATKGGVSYKGVMNLSGGTVHSNGNFKIGDGWEGAKGEFTMTGGTLNVTGPNGIEFWVGNGHAGDYSTMGTGTANISSGTLNVGSWLVVGRDGGVGTLTISGDAVVNQGVADAGAMLELGNFGQNNTSILNLDGGTLAVNGIYDNGGAGDSTTFNFNGGTLRARQNNGDFLNADTVSVKNGGAVIDSNGFNITIDNVLAANGAGGLTKDGSGTLTLNGASTYTGATLINGGTVSLGASGSIDNTSGVSLGTSGTFDVSAKGGYTVNNLIGSGDVLGTLAVSTQLAIGNSTGSIDFSSDLTLGGGSTYLFELLGGGSSADLADVAGSLSLSGGTLDLVQIGTYTVGDKFTLFAYDGSLTGNFGGLLDGDEFSDADGFWMIDYNDTSAGSNGGTGSSYVTITAIPEPRAALLGGLGMLMLLRRRRR